jgi:2-desacetyl-2-hydroxyethyl bacteriochlorophyllide A dehydrogenase
MVTARTLWFEAPRTVTIRSSDVPALGEGDVLVRTAFSGISAGTEMLAYRGELDPDLPVDETIGALGGTFRYPFRYGYSCVGVVEQSRSELAEGDLVFAFQPHQDVFVAGADQVVVLGAVDARQATLFPLVETALQITLDGGPLLGETVVVLGLGVVGALSALMLRRTGARVIAVEPRDWRREMMEGLGVETVAPDALDDALRAGGQPRQVALVVEASGNPDALRSSFRLLAHEGTVLVASWYGNKEVSLPLGDDFHRRRLTIRSTQVSTIPVALTNRWDRARRTRAVVALLAELPLDRLASHTFTFEHASDAYAAIDTAAEGLMHLALGYR